MGLRTTRINNPCYFFLGEIRKINKVMAETCLQMDQVSLRRGEQWILKNISWEVKQGEHWAILGGNGSGKTTLMRIATGYLGASQGRVFLLEGWINQIILPEVRKKIGFVSSTLSDHLFRWWSQVPGLEVVLSGQEAVIGAYTRSTHEQKQKAQELLQSFGMEYLATRPFGLMSSGERQICLIARARFAQNQLLILDEPCAGLDLSAREQVLRVISHHCGLFTTEPTLLITHHPEEIVPGITHVLLLKNGTVLAAGLREKVLIPHFLSETYEIPLRVIHENGRVWVIPEDTKYEVKIPH
jgi:iron complex transport system ATP-binding protein